MDSESCTECKDRTKYGETCEIECSNGCKDDENISHICKFDTGRCELGCKDNFTSLDESGKCDACVDGLYGINCDKTCGQWFEEV